MITTAVAAYPPVSNPTISVRRADGTEHECGVRNTSDQLLRDARPWRNFRWYFGQKHYSGDYWAATMRAFVKYESRLELTRLLFADFDRDVSHIVSQPFLMRAVVEGKARKHVPDYLLFGRTGVTVVDVKPRSRLEDPAVAATFSWVRQVVEDRGWVFEIATEPDPIRLANVRFLAGFRNPTGISAALLEELDTRTVSGRTLAEAVALVESPAPCVRAAIFHMLWRHDVSVDLTRPLSSRTVLRKSK